MVCQTETTSLIRWHLGFDLPLLKLWVMEGVPPLPKALFIGYFIAQCTHHAAYHASVHL